MKATIRLYCPEIRCRWYSATVALDQDDGSLMTSYRQHFEREHIPVPIRHVHEGDQ